MKVILMIILILVVLNAVFLFFYLNKPQNFQEPIIQEQKVQKVEKKLNQTSENRSIEFYIEDCLNSTKNFVKDLENITNITELETRFFDKEDDVKYYLTHNWSNNFYDIKGMEKDITEKTVVLIFNIISKGERNFTIPILCDENGKIGNYSSCLLNKIPSIPSACYNFTINLTECEIEWREHHILEDIQYWVEPPGAAFIIGGAGSNKTEITFNFTINSSRNKLESFGMNIIERTFNPLKDSVIFSSTKLTPDGKGGSIIKDINITDRRNVEFFATVWFKKKCYDKYVIY